MIERENELVKFKRENKEYYKSKNLALYANALRNNVAVAIYHHIGLYALKALLSNIYLHFQYAFLNRMKKFTFQTVIFE